MLGYLWCGFHNIHLTKSKSTLSGAGPALVSQRTCSTKTTLTCKISKFSKVIRKNFENNWCFSFANTTIIDVELTIHFGWQINKPSTFACLTLENCKVPHPNYGHAIMGNPSTMIYYAISSTQVRFIIDFPAPKLPPIANGTMARFLKTVIASQVPGEMYNALMSSIEKDGGIRTMPVSCMPASPCLVPGALLLGDALNMRHAITGGGMTVALHDVSLLCTLFTSLDLHDTSALIKFTRHFYNMRKVNVLISFMILGHFNRRTWFCSRWCLVWMWWLIPCTHCCVHLLMLNPEPSSKTRFSAIYRWGASSLEVKLNWFLAWIPTPWL